MDRKDLKIQALLEKISNLTAAYENQIADLRVDITILSQENEQLRAKEDEGVKEEVVVGVDDVQGDDI